MKKRILMILILVTSLCLTVFAAGACADGENILTAENFPDANFLAALQQMFPDGLSAEEAACVEELNVTQREITDMTGLEYFTGLEYLYCGYNLLSSIDTSTAPQLKELFLDDNYISEIDISCNQLLEIFSIGANFVQEINLENNENLIELDCYETPITSLDLSANPNLRYLYCDHSRLTELDLSHQEALTDLFCCENRLRVLSLGEMVSLTNAELGPQYIFVMPEQVSGQLAVDLEEIVGAENLANVTVEENDAVTYDDSTGMVYVSPEEEGFTYYYDHGNSDISETSMAVYVTLGEEPEDPGILTEEKFPDANFRAALQEIYPDGLSEKQAYTVKTLNVSEKQIESLDGLWLFSRLEELDCSGNYLTSLDLSSLSQLAVLDCRNNILNALDVSTNQCLRVIHCDGNMLRELDLSSLPYIENTSTYGRQSIIAVSDSDGQNTFVRMEDVVSEAGLQRISFDNDILYDADTGRVTVPAEAEEFVYFFETGYGLMEVTVCPGGRNILDENAWEEAGHDWQLYYYLTELYPNGLSEKEAAEVKSLDLTDRDFYELAGISVFPELEELIYRYDNPGDYFYPAETIIIGALSKLKVLDISGRCLTFIELDGNPDLEVLRCSGNCLTELDISKNKKLKELDCSCNSLTELDVSGNRALKELNLSQNCIDGLDVSENSSLRTLNCSYTHITNLDVSGNASLQQLQCDGCFLRMLDLSANTALSELSARSQQIFAEAVLNGDSLEVDMKDVVGEDNIANVTPLNALYDADTGIALPDDGEDVLRYAYNTGRGTMEVKARLRTADIGVNVIEVSVPRDGTTTICFYFKTDTLEEYDPYAYITLAGRKYLLASIEDRDYWDAENQVVRNDIVRLDYEAAPSEFLKPILIGAYLHDGTPVPICDVEGYPLPESDYVFPTAEYFEWTLEDEQGEYGDLLKYLVNYSVYTDIYFNGSSEATPYPMEPRMTMEELSGYAEQTYGELPEGLTYEGSSLILNSTSSTTIRYFFTAEDGIGDYSFRLLSGGGEWEVVPKRNGPYYTIDNEVRSIINLNEPSGVYVSGKGAEFELSSNVMSYIYKVMTQSDDEALRNVAGTLADYYKFRHHYLT